jgi:hypothetical protein
MVGFHYFDIRHNYDGRAVSSTHRPPLPPGTIRGTHFCYRLSGPQDYFMRTEGLGQLKISKELTGNRVLNQLHRVPHHRYWKNLKYFHVQSKLGEFWILTLHCSLTFSTECYSACGNHFFLH